MKKRILRIAALCAAVALSVCVLCFANGLVGNPISWALARHTAKEYVKTAYADTDYEIESVNYSFKDAGYYAHVVTPASPDGSFTLRISMLGKLRGDDYKYRVENHGNTAIRLYSEYRKLVDGVIDSPSYPYNVSIGYGDLEFDYELGKTPSPNAVSRSELVNDKAYNVGALGATNGRLVLVIDSDTVDYKTAAQVLLLTRELMDYAGAGFYVIDLELQYPPYEEGSYSRPEGSVWIEDFLYSDIYEEGLTDRIAEYDKPADDTVK